MLAEAGLRPGLELRLEDVDLEVAWELAKTERAYISFPSYPTICTYCTYLIREAFIGKVKAGVRNPLWRAGGNYCSRSRAPRLRPRYARPWVGRWAGAPGQRPRGALRLVHVA